MTMHHVRFIGKTHSMQYLEGRGARSRLPWAHTSICLTATGSPYNVAVETMDDEPRPMGLPQCNIEGSIIMKRGMPLRASPAITPTDARSRSKGTLWAAILPASSAPTTG